MSHRRSRIGRTSAISAPISTGGARIGDERRNTSRNGRSANAAESGVRLVGAVGGAQPVARAPVLGREPQQAVGGEDADARAARRRGSTQPATARRGRRTATPPAAAARRRSRTGRRRCGGRRGGARSPSRQTATRMPSELPRQNVARSRRRAAARARRSRPPAGRRAARPSRYAIAIASMPPARAITSHRFGAASPKNEKTVVKNTGSGFHDGPLTVLRSRLPISRPQMIHAHGS